MKKLIMALVVVAISSNLVCSQPTQPKTCSIFKQLYIKCLEEKLAAEQTAADHENSFSKPYSNNQIFFINQKVTLANNKKNECQSILDHFKQCAQAIHEVESNAPAAAPNPTPTVNSSNWF
jgi:hypothetical protein